ncbi:hypothetical protein [Amycolatopsis nalaikhensis]|uniref:Uncharacterized protein n=1 Tax=Amycolatopsis nalaikhensis TaxID=715472 RepID=A0ABY8Y405_9PSEU|nr:hypothetical protein [Amycolatopsis sp. 2-2]WIV62351.1 hypothetical protein QP939_17620 [Amycolatopsis sp. 2-2]
MSSAVTCVRTDRRMTWSSRGGSWRPHKASRSLCSRATGSATAAAGPSFHQRHAVVRDHLRAQAPVVGEEAHHRAAGRRELVADLAELRLRVVFVGAFGLPAFRADFPFERGAPPDGLGVRLPGQLARADLHREEPQFRDGVDDLRVRRRPHRPEPERLGARPVEPPEDDAGRALGERRGEARVGEFLAERRRAGLQVDAAEPAAVPPQQRQPGAGVGEGDAPVAARGPEFGQREPPHEAVFQRRGPAVAGRDPGAGGVEVAEGDPGARGEQCGDFGVVAQAEPGEPVGERGRFGGDAGDPPSGCEVRAQHGQLRDGGPGFVAPPAKPAFGAPGPAARGRRLPARQRGERAGQLGFGVFLVHPQPRELFERGIELGGGFLRQPGGEQGPRLVDGQHGQHPDTLRGVEPARRVEVAQGTGDVAGEDARLPAAVGGLREDPFEAFFGGLPGADLLALVEIGEGEPDAPGVLVQHGAVEQRPGEHDELARLPQQRDGLVEAPEGFVHPADQDEDEPALLAQDPAPGVRDEGVGFIEQREPAGAVAERGFDGGVGAEHARGEVGPAGPFGRRLFRGQAEQFRGGADEAAADDGLAVVGRRDGTPVQVADPVFDLRGRDHGLPSRPEPSPSAEKDVPDRTSGPGESGTSRFQLSPRELKGTFLSCDALKGPFLACDASKVPFSPAGQSSDGRGAHRPRPAHGPHQDLHHPVRHSAHREPPFGIRRRRQRPGRRAHLDRVLGGRRQPAVQPHRPARLRAHVHHDRQALAVERDQPTLLGRAAGDRQPLLFADPHHLEVDVLQLDREPDLVHQRGGHRVGVFPQFAQSGQQPEVELVQRLVRAGWFDGGHSQSPSPLASSCSRRRARQRPLVGPILPLGMPSRAPTSA